MPLLLFAFCSILLKTKNNVKNTLFASMLVRIGQNNQIFVKDCYFYQNILRGCPPQNGRYLQIEPAVPWCDNGCFFSCVRLIICMGLGHFGLTAQLPIALCM